MHATPVCDLVVLSLTADVHSLILFTSTIDPVAVRFIKWWNGHSNLGTFDSFTSSDYQRHWTFADMKRCASAMRIYVPLPVCALYCPVFLCASACVSVSPPALLCLCVCVTPCVFACASMSAPVPLCLRLCLYVCACASMSCLSACASASACACVCSMCASASAIPMLTAELRSWYGEVLKSPVHTSMFARKHRGDDL